MKLSNRTSNLQNALLVVLERRQRIFASLFFIVLVFMTAVGISKRYVSGYADTAGFLELVTTQPLNFGLKSEYFGSVQALFELYGAGRGSVCDLIPLSNTYELRVIFGHPYLISIPLAIIHKVLGWSPHFYAAFILSISTWSGLFAVGNFLRRHVRHHSLKMAYAIVIFLYPILTLSLSGQPYFDRLLFGPAIILSLNLWEIARHRRNDVGASVVCIVVMTLVSERGALLAALVSIGYSLLLFGVRPSQLRPVRILLAVGLLSIAWIGIWFTVVERGPSYASVSLRETLERFSDALLNPSPAVKDFFLVSIPFLVLCLLGGRMVLLAAITWLSIFAHPVSILNLNNYLSHYHQLYLPILIAGGAVGVVRLSDFVASRRRRFSYLGVSVAAFIFLANLSSSNIERGFQNSKTAIALSVWVPFWSDAADLSAESAEIVQSFWSLPEVAQLRSMQVSLPESIMPSALIAGVNDVEYWPRGVGAVEAVIVPYRDGLPNVLPHADPSGVREILTTCVAKTLSTSYRRIWSGSVGGSELGVFVKR